jgi:hypothetical protein
MGSIYPRGNVLWLAFVDASGKRKCRSSGLLVGRESEARATLEAIERQVAAEIRHADEDFSGPPTVAAYARRFVKARKAAGVGSAPQEEARFRDYINPFEMDGAPFGLTMFGILCAISRRFKNRSWPLGRCATSTAICGPCFMRP